MFRRVANASGQDGPCWLVLRSALYQRHCPTLNGVQFTFLFSLLFCSVVLCLMRKASLWMQDNGKPYQVALNGDIPAAVAHFRYNFAPHRPCSPHRA